MSAETLLSRLAKVKRVGDRDWIACCPAHEDRTPSLAVTETSIGRILVHCFAGCDIGAVLGAVGLEMGELFEDGPIAMRLPPTRQRFPAHAVLECVAGEALIVHVAAAAIKRGEQLSESDDARVALAASRLQEAVDAVR